MKNVIVLIIISGVALACSPYKTVYRSRNDANLRFVNDSVVYFSHRGGSGSYAYRREGDVVRVAGTIKGTRLPYQPDMEKGEVFEVWNDSIVLPRIGLVLYNPVYYEDHHLGDTFYFIQNGTKYKATPDNSSIRQYFEEQSNKFFTDLVPPEQALKEYNIKPNYNCWLVTEFPANHHDPHDLD